VKVFDYLQELTLFYNFGGTAERPPPRTIRRLIGFSVATKRAYQTVAQQWINPGLFVAAGKCVWRAVG
jgi:hypothetical protein